MGLYLSVWWVLQVVSPLASGFHFHSALESSQSNVSPSINRASIAIFSSVLLSFRGSASMSMFGSVLVDGTALSVVFASLCTTVIVEVTGEIMLALVTVVVVVDDVVVTTLVMFVYIPELFTISRTVYCAAYGAYMNDISVTFA